MMLMMMMESLCAVCAEKSATPIPIRKLHFWGSKIDLLAHPHFSIPFFLPQVFTAKFKAVTLGALNWQHIYSSDRSNENGGCKIQRCGS